MTKNRAGNLVIDVRDQRIPGGRITLSSRTSRLPEFRRREAAVRTLIERGERNLLQRLRKRRLRIEAVVQALADGDVDRLRVRTAKEGPSLTLRAACDRLLQMVRATRATSTYARYRSYARLLCAAFGDGHELASLQRIDLEAWIHAPKETTRGGKPWAPHTQRGMVAFVGQLYGREIAAEAERTDDSGERPRVKRSPAKGAEVAGKPVQRVEFLRPPEWRGLIKAVGGRPVAALVALGALAGLRIGECAHLRAGIDVELNGPEPVIHVQPREGAHAWGPKHGSVRDVPVGQGLLRILRTHVASGFAGQVYLLASPFAREERPLSTYALRCWTAEAFGAAGIRYGRVQDALTHHSLRHTFASWLIQEDVSPLKVAKLLGNSVDMVVTTYAHLIPSDLRRAIAVLDRKVMNEKARTTAT